MKPGPSGAQGQRSGLTDADLLVPELEDKLFERAVELLGPECVFALYSRSQYHLGGKE